MPVPHDAEIDQALTIMRNAAQKRRDNHPGGYWCHRRRPCPECVNPIAAYRQAANHLPRGFRRIARAAMHLEFLALARQDRRRAAAPPAVPTDPRTENHDH